MNTTSMFYHCGFISVENCLRTNLVNVVGTPVKLPFNTILDGCIDYQYGNMSREANFTFKLRPHAENNIIVLSWDLAGMRRMSLMYDGITFSISLQDVFDNLFETIPIDANVPRFRVRIADRKSVFEIHELQKRIEALETRLEQVYYMPGAPGFLKSKKLWYDHVCQHDKTCVMCTLD